MNPAGSVPLYTFASAVSVAVTCAASVSDADWKSDQLRASKPRTISLFVKSVKPVAGVSKVASSPPDGTLSTVCTARAHCWFESRIAR